METSRKLLAGGWAARTQPEVNSAVLAHERFLMNRQGGERANFAAMELSGLNFVQRQLVEVDFSGSTLVGATLARANLERAVFYCADLRLADLRHALLSHADMRGASLRGANLSCAMLDHVDLRAAAMTRAGAPQTFGNRLSPVSDSRIHVDFGHCSMKRACLNGANLEGVSFRGALLQGADFKGAKLVDVSFKSAVLTGVNLQNLDVPAEALAGAIIDPSPAAVARANVLKTQLEFHRQWIRTGGREGAPAVFDGEDLRPLQSYFAGRHLTGFSARNAIAVGVDFSGCQLQGARFEGADLRDAEFGRADLRAASFRAAHLTYARFAGADLRALRLNDGRKQNVDLSDAIADAQQFANALLDDSACAMGIRAPDEAELF